MKENFDREVDFLVIGSGAAGLSAAIRAHDLGMKVLIAEKSGFYGGSTAMSGGVCWMPNTPGMAECNIADSRDEAIQYLTAITGSEANAQRLQTYVDSSLDVLAYFQENTRVRFDPMRYYTDYYPEAPGGKPGGRSMESRPFDGRELAEEFGNLRAPHPQSQILGKFGITAARAQLLLVNDWRSKLYILGCFFLYALRFLRRRQFGRDTHLTAGNALVARLRASLMDRGVEVSLLTKATELVIESGRVVGAQLDSAQGPIRVKATAGVLLAAGGFERNKDMRREHQPHPSSDAWTAAHHENIGEGIRMGVDAGGAVDLMDEAWWTPTTLVPGQDSAWVLVVEKNLPGGIIVNRHGKRYTNEAAPYNDVVKAMYADEHESGAAIPSVLVVDARFRHHYPLGPVAPGYAMPDQRVGRKYRKDFLIKAASMEELASKLSIPSAALQETVERFNAMAKSGEDDDFGRGASLADRYYGDPRIQPNPCLAPIAKPPFYAIRVYPGDLGTKGGLRTDAKGRVLSSSGQSIPGLFAAGNCSAAVMERTYPGAGGTIGPALTFGFLSAETAAAQTSSSSAASPAREAS
jgi:3-oxosteroid 1-dehydrogenase